MACNFSCFMSFSDSLKENDVGVFHSDSGDVYKVKYRSNVCRDLLLRIEWNIPKQILFTVKLYSTSFKRCFSSKGMVINGKKAFVKLRGAFNVSNSRNYKVLCVINLIPYIKFIDNNSLPAESLDNSECVESEFRQSSVEENNVMYEEMCFENEKNEENSDVKNDFIAKINEIDIPNRCENEMVNVLSGKNDFKLQNMSLTDEIMIEESNKMNSENIAFDKSESSVLVMNKGSSSSREYDDKIVNENVHKNSENKIQTDVVYLKNSENRKTDLKDNLTGNRKNEFGNSDKRNYESALSNDTSPDENANVGSYSKDEIFNAKILAVDDYSEEIIENIRTINIHNNLEANDTFSENNSSMDVDLVELSYESHSVLYNEDISLSNSDNNASEEISTNISQESNQTEEMEFHALSEHKDTSYSQDIVKSVISCKDMKDKIMESSDISKNENHDEKHYGEKHLTNLSNCNIGSPIQNSDLSIIENVNPSHLKSDSLQTDVHKCSEIINTTEINDTPIVSHKSESQILSSSKTGLVFQTLVRKLSVDECDLPLTDAKEKIASSSGESSSNSLESETDKIKSFPIMESELKGLSMDMLDLLTSGDMADAQITNGDKHIKVHRAIVSARSSVLMKLFVKHKTDDINYSAVVDIPTYILEEVIIFLYVGLVYIKSKKMAKDLYQAAEKYRINDLIDICSKHV